VDSLATRLGKVKSSMDNGAFVFNYNNSGSVAMHKDWLFRDHTVTKTDYKRERIDKIKIEEEGVGILYDSGRLCVPIDIMDISEEKYTCVNDFLPLVTISTGLQIKQKIKDFGFYKNINTRALYVLTVYGSLYYIDLSTLPYLGIKIELPSDGIRLFSGSNSLYLLTYDGSIYVAGKNDHGQLLTGSIDPTNIVGSVEGSLYPKTFVDSGTSSINVEEIKSRYGKTFIKQKDGLVIAYGDGSNGALGTGNNNNSISPTTCILNYESVKDIAIGKNHTLFLMDDNTVMGVGQNLYGQLGIENYIEDNIYEPVEINFYGKIRSVLATKYGTVGIDFYGNYLYTGTFVDRELHGYLEESERPLETDIALIDGVNYNFVFVQPTVKKIFGGIKRGTISLFINKIVDIGTGILFYLENGECIFTGKNIDHFMNLSLGDSVMYPTNIENEGLNDINRISNVVDNKWSYMKDILMRMDPFSGNTYKSIYYKNDNGNWINWTLLCAAYSTTSATFVKDVYGKVVKNLPYLYGLANTRESFYLVPQYAIPCLDYIDETGVLYKINKYDGKHDYDFQNTVHFDTLNESSFSIEIFSRYFEETYGTQPPLHQRVDVKLNILNEYNFNKFITWINGSIPPFKRYADNKSQYLDKGTMFIPVVRKCEKSDTPVVLKDATKPTVVEPEVPTELRWDFNVRLFGWENVEVTNPEEPNNVMNETFVYRSKQISIPKQLNFPEPLEEDTFILLLNGVVVPESEYEIDKLNNNRIVLKGYRNYILTIFTELLGINENINSFIILSKLLTSNKFTIVRFNSTLPLKKAKIFRDREILRNSPYPGNVSFREIKYNDLILVDGHYIPFIWENIKSIRYPDTLYTLHDSISDFIESSDIYRLRVYLEDK